MELTKKQAVYLAVKYGKMYKEKLANTKVLIIYRDREDLQLKHLELWFRPSNYQHLTGLILVDEDNKDKEDCSVEFYHKCTGLPSLSASEIRFKDDGTTPLKLHVLPHIMDLTKITKICGTYNGSKPNLEADMVAGGVNFTLALEEYDDDSGFFFPLSALLEDIRKLTNNASQVLGIFQKPATSNDVYVDIKYIAKGVPFDKIVFPEKIAKMFSLKKYSPLKK